MLFVHQGNISDGERFFAMRWPGARGIADPEHRLYDDFRLARAKPAQVVGPRVWLRGLTALLKGHIMGRIIGDPWLLSGLFLVRDETIIWEHRAQHSADHPDFDGIAMHLKA